MVAPSRKLSLAVLGVLLSLWLAGAASAQPGRGGRGGPGDRGGPGGPGSDFRARILQSMDANGNGVLEPSEVSDRGRGFVERMAREAGLDPSQPLPISRLTGSGDGRDGGRSRYGGDDRRREGDRDRGGSSRERGSSRESGEDLYPKVPIFGDPSVAGFGISPLAIAGKIVDLEKKYDRRVLEYVERTMDRYDRNKNGILEHDEWAGVSWRGDPRESDLDKDGQLTKAEMAERIATRSAGRDDDNRSSSGGSSRFGGRGDSDDRRRDEGRGPPGSFGRGGGGDRRDRGDEGGGRGRGPSGRGGFGDPSEFISRLDANGDGTIQPDEVDERRRQFFADRFQLDFSRPVRVDDIRRRFGSRDGRNSRSDSESEEGVAAAYRVEGEDRFKGRRSFRIRGPELPTLLPPWWEQKDKNRDGQVTLGEFMTFPSDREAQEFRKHDSNRDGIITAREAEIIDKVGSPDKAESGGPEEKPEEKTEDKEGN